ncbi:hypothetical protein M413DRAFT_440466 [Hebeloma cylindrosporum]|uniref:Uncharacterized protein n=1 Tax=Hebeloma cylindrosporum TaxID=76867 RepID=A0A0C3CDN9_HEBCY|nr:hypothetical protein M413DRAFT_440466 [Hebeloma cylindrosporum h7]
MGGSSSLAPELALAPMSNAKIQQSFRAATQNVTSILRSNETVSEENIEKVKDSLAEWLKICKEAVQIDVPLNWEGDDPIVGWESILASWAWLPPKFLKQFKANFSWFMANVDVTVSSSKATSESTGVSEESGEVGIESASKTPSRKRRKTGDRSATRIRDEDWEPTTPKRSPRKPTPKVGWGEPATKKKREQPVFNPEKHFWNKMKCTHCIQRTRAPERPCFFFKTGPKRCARCVFDNTTCHPSDCEETGGLEPSNPQKTAPQAATPTPMTPPTVSTGRAALDTPTPSSSINPLSNSPGASIAQSLNASLWSPGFISSLATTTPSPFLMLPGLPGVGGQLLNIGHQQQSPFSTIGLDVAAEIQALYARARWMQENTQGMIKRIQELEALLVKTSTV